jgi:hypothetical protein
MFSSQTPTPQSNKVASWNLPADGEFLTDAGETIKQQIVGKYQDLFQSCFPDNNPLHIISMLNIEDRLSSRELFQLYYQRLTLSDVQILKPLPK